MMQLKIRSLLGHDAPRFLPPLSIGPTERLKIPCGPFAVFAERSSGSVDVPADIFSVDSGPVPKGSGRQFASPDGKAKLAGAGRPQPPLMPGCGTGVGDHVAQRK